eukprot:TRINITY_DN9743_c0_g1_i1.p1 TRINITY_DN9743_c0_g1~~TRINITY_DN9743_c0_g1_i1.p1  ORF type:complete len:189 (+),score=50.73 TRINITY_DN9743_c0_g1_i1:87-569(+)
MFCTGCCAVGGDDTLTSVEARTAIPSAPEPPAPVAVAEAPKKEEPKYDPPAAKSEPAPATEPAAGAAEQEQEIKTFKVKLTKRPGAEKIGLDVKRDDKGLKILTVKEGLVQEWNKTAAPHEQINSGSIIKQVNNVSDNHATMLQTIANSETLDFEIHKAD